MKNFKFKIGDRSYAVDIENVNDKIATVNVNGVIYEVEVDKKLKTARPLMPRKDFVPSTDIPVAVKADKLENGKAIIRAPLPGKIVAVMVKAGDKVYVGQTVICIEAMKMENNIRTDKEGVVTAVHVEANVAVMDAEVLIEIE
jgi:glutaconyl-CoA/methylmalonyl-CoA decarboxylase subunit gamma